jgi:hypothetical protein
MRSAVGFNNLKGQSYQSLDMLSGIGYGGRAAYELGTRSVAVQKPPQPPQHVAHVRAKDAPVGMDLIDDHVSQPAEKPPPGLMVREYTEVEHVRVGEHDLS